MASDEDRAWKGSMAPDPEFSFGRTSRLGACCNKPVGCSMAPQGCVYPNHEWKVRHCPHLFSDEERARLLARLDDQDREADHG